MLTYFQRFINYVVNISAIRANSKCQFIVQQAVSKIHSQNSYYKTNASLLIICFVSLQLFDKAFSIHFM